MFKRRLVRWGLGVAMLLLAWAVLVLLPSQNSGSRVYPGMTFLEVKTALAPTFHEKAVLNATGPTYLWHCPDGTVTVAFDWKDVAVSTDFAPRQTRPLDRLRAWLGW